MLSHQLQPTSGLSIGGIKLKHVESYCYLGIEIHYKGTFSAARSELKKMSMRYTKVDLALDHSQLSLAT